MAFFDRFRKQPSVPPQPIAKSPTLPQLSYDVAYRVLPHYAFNNLAKLTELCLRSPTAAGPFFYTAAALLRKIEPNKEHAIQFHWHLGRFPDNREYFALEYPVPPPVDISDDPMQQILTGSVVLAPHFSAIVRSPNQVDYFILGQAPMGGGTTLRCILPEGANCNLGPGPNSHLPDFLNAVQARANKS